MQGQPGLVVAHGLGSGKTFGSIAAAVRLKPDRTQVLVPASLRENYEKEVRKHVSGGIPGLEIGSLQRSALKGVQPSDLLIVDEAHRARDPQSKTHRELRKAVASKRMLLTASPVYNRPSDIAPLVNLAAGDRRLPTGTDFDKRYLKKPSNSFLALLPWAEKKTTLVRKGELAPVLNQWVDYHRSSGGDFPERKDSKILVPMTGRQTDLHDMAWGKLPVMSRMRLRAGLPAAKKDLASINAFQSQVRQISNSERRFSGEGTVAPSPKVERAAGMLAAAAAKNPRHKAVVYSNYLDTIDDYKGALGSKVPHAEFSGRIGKKDRDQAVKDYNKGKIKALLVSSAGGEGLDLKGTRQVQVMEPHWNDEKLHQVIGRAVRHGSHSHLPKAERRVDVQRFESHPTSAVRRWFGLKPREGIDQVLSNLSSNKEQLNKELVGLMQKKANYSPKQLKKLRQDIEAAKKGHTPFRGPPSKNEPLHMKYGPAVHFGTGRKGAHYGRATGPGVSEHLYKKRVFVGGKAGGYGRKLTPAEQAQVAHLFKKTAEITLLTGRMAAGKSTAASKYKKHFDLAVGTDTGHYAPNGGWVNPSKEEKVALRAARAKQILAADRAGKRVLVEGGGGGKLPGVFEAADRAIVYKQPWLTRMKRLYGRAKATNSSFLGEVRQDFHTGDKWLQLDRIKKHVGSNNLLVAHNSKELGRMLTRPMHKTAAVLGHITGVSGAGKTTLLRSLQKKHPQLVTKDTDEWFDEARDRLGVPRTSVHPTRGKAAFRQATEQVARDFLRDNKDKPVLLGGGFIWQKGRDILRGHEPKAKMMLDTGPLKSSWRRYKRKNERPWAGEVGVRHGKLSNIPHNYRKAKRHMAAFKERGYVPMSPQQIEQTVASKLKTAAAFGGLPIEIERKRGAVHSGVNRHGVAWSKKAHNDYGYIPGTRGLDREPVDVYMGPSKRAPNAFVVHQKSPDGRWYDEDKVMLGFKNEGQARRAYLKNMGSMGKKVMGPITPMKVKDLQAKAARGGTMVLIGKPAIAQMRQEMKKHAAGLMPGLGLGGDPLGSIPYEPVGSGPEFAGMSGPTGMERMEAQPGATLEQDVMLRPSRYLDRINPLAARQMWDDRLTAKDEDDVVSQINRGLARGAMQKASAARLEQLARERGPITKIARQTYQGLLGELYATGVEAGVIKQAGQSEEVRLARKAGPGIGGAVGAGVGALIGAKRGQPIRGALAGLGTGATLGWTPDMYHSAKEGLKKYKRQKEKNSMFDEDGTKLMPHLRRIRR
jgi:superfamily II DNA or RNA helicase/shikimate kinase